MPLLQRDRAIGVTRGCFGDPGPVGVFRSLRDPPGVRRGPARGRSRGHFARRRIAHFSLALGRRMIILDCRGAARSPCGTDPCPRGSRRAAMRRSPRRPAHEEHGSAARNAVEIPAKRYHAPCGAPECTAADGDWNSIPRRQRPSVTLVTEGSCFSRRSGLAEVGRPDARYPRGARPRDVRRVPSQSVAGGADHPPGLREGGAPNDQARAAHVPPGSTPCPTGTTAPLTRQADSTGSILRRPVRPCSRPSSGYTAFLSSH